MEKSWEHIRNTRFSPQVPPPEWPAGVKPISMNGLSLIGVDPHNRLYWDGREIAFRVKLTGYQNLLATLAALGAVATGITAVLQYFWPHGI